MKLWTLVFQHIPSGRLTFTEGFPAFSICKGGFNWQLAWWDETNKVAYYDRWYVSGWMYDALTQCFKFYVHNSVVESISLEAVVHMDKHRDLLTKRRLINQIDYLLSIRE